MQTKQSKRKEGFVKRLTLVELQGVTMGSLVSASRDGDSRNLSRYLADKEDNSPVGGRHA
jgi:hypothetical protein